MLDFRVMVNANIYLQIILNMLGFYLHHNLANLNIVLEKLLTFGVIEKVITPFNIGKKDL